MRIEALNTRSPGFEKYQAFVKKHGLLFNSPEWINNYQEANIFQCAIWNKNEEVIGCFTYYRFKKSIFKFIITAPYSPNIDLFYINPAESIVGRNSFKKDILSAVCTYFEDLGVQYINLNLPYDTIDTQPFIWKGYTSKTRYSYIIDLSASKETLWENLSSEKRKSINKALKDNLVIKESTDYQLIHSLIVKSLERNDKNRNQDILKNILFSFSSAENSFAFVAYHNNMPIGATYCVKYKDRAVYLFGGFDAENKHHGAGVSCMWQSILKAKEAGLKYFDFEGSMYAAIERYFREFGGELHPYFCVEKIKPALNILLTLKGHKPL